MGEALSRILIMLGSVGAWTGLIIFGMGTSELVPGAQMLGMRLRLTQDRGRVGHASGEVRLTQSVQGIGALVRESLQPVLEQADAG